MSTDDGQRRSVKGIEVPVSFKDFSFTVSRNKGKWKVRCVYIPTGHVHEAEEEREQDARAEAIAGCFRQVTGGCS